MKSAKKLGSLLILITVFLTAVFSFDLTTRADKKPYMKNADARWNLKPNKEISFKTYYSGYGYINVKAKVKNLKIENVREESYNKLSCKIEYSFPKLKLSKKQVEKILENDNIFRYMWTILDYDTGLSLEGANDLDVKVEYGDWKHSDDVYKYNGYKGSWISYSKSASKEIEVTYPEDYKGLCLIIGGSTNPKKPDDEFFDGEFPLKESVYYKKGLKDLSSCLRIKDIKNK